jgi:hypothetical protein
MNEDQLLEKFNAWAANPSDPLPPEFALLSNKDINLREKQELRPAYKGEEGPFIISKDKKYIFPNPNMIDQLGGNIDRIFRIDGKRLAKGANKLYLTKLTPVINEGWIEYQNEVKLNMPTKEKLRAATEKLQKIPQDQSLRELLEEVRSMREKLGLLEQKVLARISAQNKNESGGIER